MNEKIVFIFAVMFQVYVGHFKYEIGMVDARTQQQYEEQIHKQTKMLHTFTSICTGDDDDDDNDNSGRYISTKETEKANAIIEIQSTNA